MNAAAPLTWRKASGEVECVFFYVESTRKEAVFQEGTVCPPKDEDSQFPSYDILNHGLGYCPGSGVWLFITY